MVNRPEYSFIFLTWNAGKAIIESLQSVREQTFDDFEIVIADNASQDDTVELIQEEFGRDNEITLIENERNLGFSAGINKAIERSRGNYICCYNHDTQFPADYLTKINEWITPNAVWTTARINYRVSEDHQCIRLRTEFGYSIPYIVDGLSGCVETNFTPGDGVIVPREIYREQLNNQIFDPSLPSRSEDVDLALRLINENVRINAILDTFSIHPDKKGIYGLGVENFRNHLQNTYSNYQAYRKNIGLRECGLAILGGVAFPVEVYLDDFPKNEADLEAILDDGAIPLL